MAILTKGQTFADGDDVTSTKLNNLVDAAAFVSGSSGTTDDSSLEVNGSGRLQIKDSGVTTGKINASAVTTAKIADATATTDGVTFAKIRQLEDMKLIGNVSGGTAAPTQVSLLDEDDMASNSATAACTQQSIVAYVGSTVNAGVMQDYTGGGTTFTGTTPGASFTDIDLSSVVGANTAFVHLSVTNSGGTTFQFKMRQNGESADVGDTNYTDSRGTTCGQVASGRISYHSIITDSAGIIEWLTNTAGINYTIKVMGYQVLQ